MREFVIGCTHFGHENIIRLANRPFSDLNEMNHEMTRRWNSVVQPDDVVYHLGDFAFKGKKAEEYLSLLNGRVVKIRGNHDHEDWGVPYLERRVNGTLVVMCHYPIEEWNGWFRGAVHLHAHTHKPDFVSAVRRGNVGADAIDFTPMPLEDAVSRLLAT